MKAEIIDWFDQEKGITSDTLHYFGVSYDPEDEAILFPYPNNIAKKRYGVPNGSRSFAFPKGTSLGLFNGEEATRNIVFLCEGETDTIRLRQELGLANDRCGVVGLSGINGWKKDFAGSFEGAEVVYVLLDNDSDYATNKVVNSTWKIIQRDIGRKTKRIYLPKEVKDVCEFFDNYDLESLKLLTSKTSSSLFSPLDLTREPPEPKWLVKNVIARGDIGLLVGEPGAGKSFLSMDLAISVAKGSGRWLGEPILGERGRVLYVDEENPLDIVYSRLFKLGLSGDSIPYIRYLHNSGISLSRDPSPLIEEVFSFEPTLVILDSLTRIHTEDENHAGAMAALFNEGIKPLARESGATVLILHHAGKTEGTSYKRTRGSGDIVASVDCAIDVRPLNKGAMACYLFKSRRGTAFEPVILEIEDINDRAIRLRETEGAEWIE